MLHQRKCQISDKKRHLLLKKKKKRVHAYICKSNIREEGICEGEIANVALGQFLSPSVVTAVAGLGSVPGSEAMGHFVIATNPLPFVLL